MIKKRKTKSVRKKVRLVVDIDMSIAMTGWSQLGNHAKLFSAAKITGSPESSDQFIYQKANEKNAHILTSNFRDYKNLVKSKKHSGIIGCKQPFDAKVAKQIEQDIIKITREYSNDDLYGKIIIVDGDGIKKKKEF